MYVNLMQLGAVTFSLRPINTHEYSVSSATEFAQKPVVGARQPYEWVGEGDQKMTISGMMLPKHLGGLNEMAVIHTMRESGIAQLLLRGDGKVLGWFLIESVDETSTNLDADGVGFQIEFSITLCRTSKPSALDFSLSIFGLDA